MIKIAAFGASSSKTSINKKFASYAANLIPNAEINLLDLNDYEMPIFSVDKESEFGIHPLAAEFREQLDAADGIVISFAEHNGAYSAAFKNILDWISRAGPKIWGNKPMLFLSTSPGARGAQTVLEIALGKLGRMTEAKIEHFSLPEFDKNFDTEITNKDLKSAFEDKLNAFLKNLA